MADTPPAPSSAAPVPARETPFHRLWRRYLSARGAKTGLVLVGAFTILALFAPFIANRLPLYWHDNATGAVSWPLVREFFSPSDTTEPMLEKGINFLLLFIPAALIAWAIMNKCVPSFGRRDSRLVSIVFGLLFAASLWLSLGGMVVAAGGGDWLYDENPPTPEMDDMENPLAVTLPATTNAAHAARALLADALPDPEARIAGADENETQRRRLLPLVQDAIDRPAVSTVGAMLASVPDFNTLGITDANSARGINAARWNRLLVEAAYPGLLAPMRNLRVTFLTMATVSFLALLGLTYIFIAGAYQFSLSPRWLVLLALAALLALPFRHSPRYDLAPYRRLAVEGAGNGIFPPIPYGPNEQGFGPRLPPSWMTEPPQLFEDIVLSWDNFEKAVNTAERPESFAIRDRLNAALPAWRELVKNPAGRGKILAFMNTLLDAPDLVPAEAAERMRGDASLSPYLAEMRAGRKLAGEQLERFNRLVIERAIPYTFTPAAAVRWKKPAHSEGYHLFGTDESGRDVLVRVIHGARVSLSVGFVSVFLATVIGLVMGSLAAYYGGKTDLLISRFLEVMMCFPSFFLILAVIAVLDKRSIVNIMLVIGLTSWTGVARLIRGEMLRQKKMDYALASVALGASDTRTIFRQILPNSMAPVLVSISFGITGAILTEAGLSFIGFGVTPPTPTWGQLLSETRESPLANWWLAVFPGIILFLSVIAYNMVGEAVRDALDPRATL